MYLVRTRLLSHTTHRKHINTVFQGTLPQCTSNSEVNMAGLRFEIFLLRSNGWARLLPKKFFKEPKPHFYELRKHLPGSTWGLGRLGKTGGGECGVRHKFISRKFVHGRNLFQEVNSFLRACLEENCDHGTDLMSKGKYLVIFLHQM